MAISNVTKYLKFASAQMAAESLFSGESANPAEIDVGKKIIDPRSLNVTPRVRVKLFCAVPT